jgi:hypothetical protein
VPVQAGPRPTYRIVVRGWPVPLHEEAAQTIHAYRFRHTLGTQLAEKGARIQDHHEDPLRPHRPGRHQSVLQPGAVIAGPVADTLRAGQLGQDALDWLKASFYKTELELGRCLRLSWEGLCECDLYLTCAKFVTSPQYAPRLRERLCLGSQLADDAQDAAGHAKWNVISGTSCGSRRFSRSRASRAEMTNDAVGRRASQPKARSRR